jgi:hypothetical protein
MIAACLVPLTLRLLAFTIQASTEQSIILPYPPEVVRAYYTDLAVYRTHFPGIVDTRQVSATESLWTYEMDPPLAPPKRMTLRLIRRDESERRAVFSTAENADDFMLCRAEMEPVGGSATKVTIALRLRMTRESGSDFHFLAPVLGQDFISEQMQKQVTGDLTLFLQRTRQDLARRAGHASH